MRDGAGVGSLGRLALISAVLLAQVDPCSGQPSQIREGPFGIYMGEPIEQLGKTVVVEPGLYRVLNPPKPNSDFTNVGVIAFPGLGVCEILANTEEYAPDPNAVRAKAKADEVSGVLKAKYGPDVDMSDYCDGEAGVCQNAWTAALEDQVAAYWYRWTKSAVAQAEGMSAVALFVKAESATSTEVQLAYFSDKQAECDDARKAAAGAGL